MTRAQYVFLTFIVPGIITQINQKQGETGEETHTHYHTAQEQGV